MEKSAQSNYRHKFKIKSTYYTEHLSLHQKHQHSSLYHHKDALWEHSHQNGYMWTDYQDMYLYCVCKERENIYMRSAYFNSILHVINFDSSKIWIRISFSDVSIVEFEPVIELWPGNWEVVGFTYIALNLHPNIQN